MRNRLRTRPLLLATTPIESVPKQLRQTVGQLVRNRGQIVQPAHPLGQVQARRVRATAGPDVPDCVLAAVDPQPTTDALVVHDHAQGRRGDAVHEAVGLAGATVNDVP